MNWWVAAEGVGREIIGDKAWRTPKPGIAQYPKQWSLLNSHEMVTRKEVN